MGIKEVHNLKIETRLDAITISQCTGIFMTGGNQLLFSTTLGVTPVVQLIYRLNAKGVNVAGTSAGTMFISGFMIAGGQVSLISRCNMVNLAPSLSLINKLLVDQHFSQRDRLGRLLAALSYNPYIIGVGIDEDTSALLNAENVIEVILAHGIVTINGFLSP